MVELKAPKDLRVNNMNSESEILSKLTASRMLLVKRRISQRKFLAEIEMFAKTEEGKLAIKLAKARKKL